MIYSKFLGVGSYVPPRVWTNQDLTSLMDTSDEWIQQRTGIKERHWVDQDSATCTSDLALEASVRALEAANVKKEEIDLIILATLSPDHEFPGTGCFLQSKLDLPGIPALDIRQQCTGFIYGISIADQFLKSKQYKKVLVVGAEVHSKGLDKTTRGRDVTVLFGDGAGAVVMGAEEGAPDEKTSRLINTFLHADGRFAKELWVPEPGLAHPGPRMAPERFDGREYPQMNGKTVFTYATKKMPEVLMESLSAAGKTLEDVDLFIFHQANLRINEMVAKQLRIPEEKVYNTISRFGNTTAATIPLGIDEAVKSGRLKKGMLVASAAFGAGFTWASALYRW
ncbi:MAG: ketoacyl-ACP synthase III [Bdellovibrio sp.]|nr:ketoacyl-ACP synthase III [Bdellovibrio sp.]